MNSKVRFIMPYFGKFPEGFPYWLMCCQNNSTFNWLIITDDTRDFSYPPNVKVIYMTLPELKKRIERKVGFSVALEKPYKLCDFRPLFGWLFEEELKGYTHWGYGDIDLLFGDLNRFVTSDILEKYSKISKLGHLSILQNTPLVNNAFLECDWKSILQSPQNRIFDEVRFSPNINTILEHKGMHVLKTLPYADIDCIHYNFHLYEYKDGNRTSKCTYLPNIYRYKDGRIYKLELIRHSIIETEIAYVHFQKRKVIFPPTILQQYLLIPNRVIEDISLSEYDMLQQCKDDFPYFLKKSYERVRLAIKIRLM